MLRRRRDPSTPDSPSAVSTPGFTTEPRVPFLGNELIGSAANAADLGDLVAARAAYDRSTNWNERHDIVQEIVSTPQRRAHVAGWQRDAPNDPLAAVAAGTAMIIEAWEIRGSGWSNTVSSDSATRFLEKLRAADAHLEYVARLDPTSPLPWSSLLTSGRGLSISLHELAFRFETGWQRAPDLLEIHRQYHQGVCAKWGGSDEMATNFVHNATSGAPEGSAIHMLHVDAAFEHSIAHEAPLSETMRHVLPTLHAAAATSVFHPAATGSVERTDLVAALNHFALAFCLAGDRDSADRCFAVLGGRYTDDPWNQWNRDVTEEVRLRREWAASAQA